MTTRQNLRTTAALVAAISSAVMFSAGLGAGVASAATVVGSDLSVEGYGAQPCDPDPCGTVVQLRLGATDLAAPISGVITRWSVRNATGQLALRVIAGSVGQRYVVASGPAVQAAPGQVLSFAAQLPVSAGQRIGVEQFSGAGLSILWSESDQTAAERYSPSLGATPSAPLEGDGINRNYELLYNATIEPDLDGDGLGDETQDPEAAGNAGPTPPAGDPAVDHGDPSGEDSGEDRLAGCPTTGVLARGDDALVFVRAGVLFGCHAGEMTPIAKRTGKVRHGMFRLAGSQLALVQSTGGRSRVQLYDLADGIQTAATRRHGAGVSITDLEITRDGEAAWITTIRRAPAKTTVWAWDGDARRLIAKGRIPARSLTCKDQQAITYTGPDGRKHHTTH